MIWKLIYEKIPNKVRLGKRAIDYGLKAKLFLEIVNLHSSLWFLHVTKVFWNHCN